MAFSSAVLLTDLNDFITPSQACIKPLPSKAPAASPSVYEVSLDTAPANATPSISLDDCLACSGCITSAESVLVQQQSDSEVERVLQENRRAKEEGRLAEVKVVIVSISPQSRASLGAKYGLDPTSVHQRLISFWKGLGVEYIFDTSFARDVSLLEGGREFVERYHLKHGSGLNSSTPPVDALSISNTPLPMLASSCPGWICYAEKTHPNLLPYISTTKSPQQTLGTLVKSYFAPRISLHRSQIYHISIMPCYDKKLEASRPDFAVDGVRDVDCVLSTGEVDRMLTNRGIDLRTVPEGEMLSLFTKAVMTPTGPRLVGTEGSSSGGYLSYIFRYAAQALFGIPLSLADMQQSFGTPERGFQVREGRNSDYTTYELWLENKCVLRFVRCYGFRNIQNVVRKIGGGTRGTALRRRKADPDDNRVDYVEVMACPGGCINGGGQIPVADAIGIDTNTQQKAALGGSLKSYAQAEAVYQLTSANGIQFPEQNEAVITVFQDWLGVGLGSSNPGDSAVTQLERDMLRTQYHGVEKTDIAGVIGSGW
ncbi:iron hydrogenase [Gaertneriomyces semiglobifer]|nr:iron hydrogenase [Gaertneriomyces semiglobifer]